VRKCLIYFSSSHKPLLSPGIRHAYSTLLRVAQLEHQLFASLFAGLGDSSLCLCLCLCL